MKVLTTEGLIDHDKLEVIDTTEWADNARCTKTEWFLDGKLVRRDGHVNVLAGFELGINT